MKNDYKRVLTAATLCFMAVTAATAHDFEVRAKSGNTLFFNIIDAKNNKVELTYDGSIDNVGPRHYSGKLNIPKEVSYKGKTYDITTIGSMAFKGCIHLESVRMQSNIKHIGNFAFEGCTSLKTVILPTGQAEMGKGVFFRCENIDSVAYGGEWTNIDLEAFRWSSKLKSLRLPAGMEKLTGLKTLPNLEQVYVTDDNLYFSSANGVLYNKSGKTLLACPKAYKGTLTVKEGTTKIQQGAVADCRYVTQIELPSTMEQMSFRELSFLTQLEELTILTENPIKTAKGKDGKPCFILKTATSKLNLVVPKKAKKAWTEAIKSQQAGNYTELDATDDDVSYVVKDTEMIYENRLSYLKM